MVSKPPNKMPQKKAIKTQKRYKCCEKKNKDYTTIEWKGTKYQQNLLKQNRIK